MVLKIYANGIETPGCRYFLEYAKSRSPFRTLKKLLPRKAPRRTWVFRDARDEILSPKLCQIKIVGFDLHSFDATRSVQRVLCNAFGATRQRRRAQATVLHHVRRLDSIGSPRMYPYDDVL